MASLRLSLSLFIRNDKLEHTVFRRKLIGVNGKLNYLKKVLINSGLCVGENLLDKSGEAASLNIYIQLLKEG
jgi:hypothetical protein